MASPDLGDLILESAERHGDRTAFQIRRGFRLDRLSFAECGERARRLAAWLEERGVQHGDRVAVRAPNMPEYAVLCFGVWLRGAVLVPVDVRTRSEVAERNLTAARPRIAFASRQIPTRMLGAVREEHALEELDELIAGTSPPARARRLPADQLAEVIFTSGTTGAPKGVMLTRGNLVAQVTALEQAFPLDVHHRALSLLPLSHVLEQAMDLLLAFRVGARMTYLPRANSATILRTMRDEGTTAYVVVPEFLRLTLQGLERSLTRAQRWRWRAAHRLAPVLPFPARRALFRPVHTAIGGRLSFIGVGGAPLEAELARAWDRMGVRIVEGYGLSEVAGAATVNTLSATRLGRVGRPLPGVDVRIGEEGEILLRGPTVSAGYLDAPERTASAFEGGWFHTGDVGDLDHDGFLRVAGRQAFKIVLPDGRNVYPEDVERVLDAHPSVREGCVGGLTDDGGERPCAVLLATDPARLQRTIDEVNERLDPHQQIVEWVVWREPDFPRTPTLEVDRDRVREVVEGERRREGGRESAPPSEEQAEPIRTVVARIGSRPASEVRDEARLETDLGLDSLGRLEIVAAIEAELGKVVDESAITPTTTVRELRELVERGVSSRRPPLGSAGHGPGGPRRSARGC